MLQHRAWPKACPISVCLQHQGQRVTHWFSPFFASHLLFFCFCLICIWVTCSPRLHVSHRVPSPAVGTSTRERVHGDGTNTHPGTDCSEKCLRLGVGGQCWETTKLVSIGSKSHFQLFWPRKLEYLWEMNIKASESQGLRDACSAPAAALGVACPSAGWESAGTPMGA